MKAMFDMEEFVAENNQFFQETGLTLDDMHVYAQPFSICKALLAAAEDLMTPDQVKGMVDLAIDQIKALHDEMNQENAA